MINNMKSPSPSKENVIKESYNLYFAGSLFDNKDLIGNLYLASLVEEASNGKYKCILPQDLEQRNSNAKYIKNNDLHYVKNTDGSIFSFDGTEPDSGTIVEFIQSKFLDKPAVLYRSDFRAGGDDRRTGADPWNLMMSNYPRTKVVTIENIIITYQELCKKYPNDLHNISKALSLVIAQPIH